MKKFILMLVPAVLLFSANSCSQNITGNGTVVEKERAIADFSKISVKDGIDLFIKQGDNIKLSVTADENLLDAIKTEVVDGMLNIYCSQNIRNSKKMAVSLTIKNIDLLNANEGSDVLAESFLNLTNLSINCKEGSDLTIKINADQLNCKFDEGSDAKITGNISILTLNGDEGSDIIANVTSKEITCTADEGSDIKLSGTTKSVLITAGEGSDIDAFALKAEDCEIHISEGSDAKVFATNKLVVFAKEDCDIIYGGNPKTKNINAGEGCDVAER